MTTNIEREISRNVPKHTPIPYSSQVEPLFTAYGCVLLERDTGKSCIYTAVNLKTGNREVIQRRPTPLTTSGVEAMAERIRRSSVAGAGRLQADRPLGDNLNITECRKILTELFHEILPRHGYNIRAEQIALAEHMLTALSRRNISLAEAGVGIGKTLAYLTAAVLVKRGGINGYYNLSFHTGTPYVNMGDMPIVIATSSIALQKALATDYIPALSEILLEHGIIQSPLTFVIRKGREHYVCGRRLRAHLKYENDNKIQRILIGLLLPESEIDLAEIDGLTTHTKRKVCVSDRCPSTCPFRDGCAYWRFRDMAASGAIDIQVCNHNYLLADTLRRMEEKRPLIPNYQCVIIDEAHKFLQAARQMYGAELSSRSLPDIRAGILNLKLKHELTQGIARKAAKILAEQSNRLFRVLAKNANSDDTDAETERFTAAIDADTAQYLRNIYAVSSNLIELLNGEPLAGNGAALKSQILWELEQVREQAAILMPEGEHISWLEVSDRETRLCAIPKDLDKRLYNDLWSKGIPIILTSGTLSANGDFTHIKRTLGLQYAGSRLIETSKPSPFDYQKNSLLYISENVPFPDWRNEAYLSAITDEIEKLVHVSNGHAAVLFTSYNAMGLVCEALKKKGLPFPVFRMDKGGVREIERFKRSGNGVLFASGSMWEGIDIPGDALSMLIIVKLPFPVPDPISEYERGLYDSFDEYKDRVMIPETVVRTLQAHGRLLRLERDSGVVAILDCRVNETGSYRDVFLDALPSCTVTGSISCVEDFYWLVKPDEYFM